MTVDTHPTATSLSDGVPFSPVSTIIVLGAPSAGPAGGDSFPNMITGRAISTTPRRLQPNSHQGCYQPINDAEQLTESKRGSVHPARASLSVNFSFSKSEPAMPVHSGARNVRTVASDSDRYWREKYTPNKPKNLEGVLSVLASSFDCLLEKNAPKEPSRKQQQSNVPRAKPRIRNLRVKPCRFER